MGWFFVAALPVSLWIFSHCLVLGASLVPFLLSSSSNDKIVGKRNILLVVAHPDDESMFFTPTLLYLTSEGHTVHILCLSTGNADGMGNTRKEELYKACSILKVPLQQVKIIDHPDLQDGFEKAWSHHLLVNIIQDEIVTRGVDLLITFDSYGVSGHRNHCDVYRGIRMLLSEKPRCIETWELISTSIARKYTGPVDIWLSMLCGFHYPKGQNFCFINDRPHKTFLAMAQHASQWVWFRKLFVVFSSYTYVNTLRKINI